MHRLFATAHHLAMVSTTGTKRGSPGADVEKSFMNVELSDEDAQKLQAVQKDLARVELLLGVSHFHLEAGTISQCFIHLARTSRSADINARLRQKTHRCKVDF